MLVYALTNTITGHIYVGQHRGWNLNKRWNGNLTNQGNPHLKNAIAKYGYQAFERRVLTYCSCQEEMDLIERFFILNWQTTNRRFGYNLEDGGRSHFEHDWSSCKTISHRKQDWWAAKTVQQRIAFGKRAREWLEMTRERRRKISDTMKERTKTSEHKKAISEGMRRSWNMRKPPQSVRIGTNYQPAENNAANRKQTKLPGALKGKVIHFDDGPARLRQIRAARRELREIQRRLDEWEFEIKGGCSW